VIVLDSDLLTLIQRGSGPEYQTLLARLQSSGDDVSVTIPSFEEQMRGWMAYVARALKQQVVASRSFTS
jgi:tRNA(fMet)-specific endonuclease VapC